MNKVEFISELRKSLSILQEEELQDIISEYEQHVDMKVQSGLSQEEAIADFGSMDELVAEILEAYHVRADYAADQKESVSLVKAGVRGGRVWLSKITSAAGKMAGFLWVMVRSCAAEIVKVSKWCVFQAGRPVKWMKEKWPSSGKDSGWKKMKMQETAMEAAELKEKSDEAEPGEEKRRGTGLKEAGRKGPKAVKKVFRNVVSTVGRLAAWCLSACFWCLRMGWNVCCIGTGVMIGMMGLVSLFGLGILAVILLQGYPVAGITLGCLGLTMCFFAAAGFCFTLLWRRKENERNGGESRKELQKELQGEIQTGGQKGDDQYA